MTAERGGCPDGGTPSSLLQRSLLQMAEAEEAATLGALTSRPLLAGSFAADVLSVALGNGILVGNVPF